MGMSLFLCNAHLCCSIICLSGWHERALALKSKWKESMLDALYVNTPYVCCTKVVAYVRELQDPRDLAKGTSLPLFEKNCTKLDLIHDWCKWDRLREVVICQC